jgi:hypothetical protein
VLKTIGSDDLAERVSRVLARHWLSRNCSKLNDALN